MELAPSGRAIAGFQEEEWVESKVTNGWSPVAAELEENEPTLQLMRTALAKTVFDNDLDLTAANRNTLFIHLPAPKRASQWFAARIQLHLHEGRTEEALEDLLAESRLPRALETDDILISELVRIAIAAIARTSVWEALQAGGWTDADLAQLAQVWQANTFVRNMTHSLEGELIFGVGEYDSMRKANSNAVDSIYGLQKFLAPDDSERPSWEKGLRVLPGGDKCADFIKEQIYCRLWRFAWLDQDEVHYLRFMEGLIDLARRAESEKSLAAIEPALDGLLEPATRGSFYNNLRFPQVTSYGALAISLKKSMKAETERSLVLAAISLKRYTLHSGESATNLQALVPEILPSVPIDYMDGQPVRYRLGTNRTFVLYSVGEDSKDDGGDSSLPSGKSSFRNLWNRKDFVWPQPATPDEIETFRKDRRAGR